MNILILGTGKVEQQLINLCLKSRYLDHIYTASSEPLNEIPNIEYENYDELVSKIRALKVDIILHANKSFVEEGLVEFLKKRKLNVFSVNQKWLNLEKSRFIAKQLLSHYNINTPSILRAPVTFPIVIKTDKKHTIKVANTMQELIAIRESITNETVFLEEYLYGEVYHILLLWDGESALYFAPQENFTEVQNDRLDLLKTKFNFMFSDEHPDFMGFFSIKLIWAKNDWYVLEFIMNIDEKSDLNLIKTDFLYLLNSAIYQKLKELTF